MAELIPCEISKDAPRAEKEVFRMIRDDERTRDWIVFYSLRIEKHISQHVGEADFVIIAPNLGCFVLEVKGGEISVEDGVWYSTDFNKEKHMIHDPFKQVDKNRWSIMEYLEAWGVSDLFFGTGVVFPETRFARESVSYVSEQIFDDRNNHDFFDYIRNLSKYYMEREIGQDRKQRFKLPSHNVVEGIRRALNDNYRSFTPLRVKSEINYDKLVECTAEQFDVLEELRRADCAIIHGPAGTGKTFLAVEMAKRKAVIKNNKVALITYNLLLTDYLKLQVMDYTNIDVFSISDHFEKICDDYGLISESDRSDKSKFYNVILPKLALKALAIGPIQYDVIIVDEAQDYSANYLLVVSQMLKGNIAKGCVYFFGDFIYQGVYDTSVYQQEFLCYIQAMGGNPVEFEVKMNVRNSLTVQKELDRISGTNTSSIHSSEGKDTDDEIYYLYENEEDEKKQVIKLLNILIKNEKCDPSKITILGRRHFDESIAGQIKEYEIKEYSVMEPSDSITFCSIRRFKGLENDFIIVVDNNDYGRGDQDLHLLYVAIGRARYKSYVFESLEAQCKREEILKHR